MDDSYDDTPAETIDGPHKAAVIVGN